MSGVTSARWCTPCQRGRPSAPMRRSYDHPARRGTVPRVELRDVMRTPPPPREFTDEPVPDEVVHDPPDVAPVAPSGGHRQAWPGGVARGPAPRPRLPGLYL